MQIYTQFSSSRTHHEVAASTHTHAANPRRRIAANAACALSTLAIRVWVSMGAPASHGRTHRIT
jgi:hypothetical protein